MSTINGIGSTPVSAARIKKTQATEEASYADVLTSQAVDKLVTELEQKYGYKISAQSIEKDQQSIEKYCMGGSSTKVAIAPNILEQMVKNANVRGRIESKIQDLTQGDKTLPQELAAYDRVYIASGLVVHEDGSTTYWVMSDDSPEKKARIQRAMEEQAEAKAERRMRFEDMANENREKRLDIASKPSELLRILEGYSDL